MIVFPEMLTSAAKDAGMKVPDDPDDFKSEEYPHFRVFCNLQLARPVVYHGEHFENAKLIANLTDKQIKTMTLEDFLKAGLSYAN